jgi:hypothetical protein
MNKNLILLSSLYKIESVDAVETLMRSIFIQPEFNKETTDILIITQANFESKLRSQLDCFDLPIDYFIIEASTPMEASSARLRVFEYKNIHQYSKILYISTSILVNYPISKIFDLEISDSKLYGIEEGWLTHPWWGGNLFSESDIPREPSGFSTSLLLFKTSNTIRKLFSVIIKHIATDKKNKPTEYLDQPYIIYNSIIQKQYDNVLLKAYNEKNTAFFYITMVPNVYNKTIKINEYMKRVYTRILNTVKHDDTEGGNTRSSLVNTRFYLKELSSDMSGSVDFREDRATIIVPNTTFWGPYNGINSSVCELHYGNQCHVLIFNSKKTFFVCIRKYDLLISYGYSI